MDTREKEGIQNMDVGYGSSEAGAKSPSGEGWQGCLILDNRGGYYEDNRPVARQRDLSYIFKGENPLIVILIGYFLLAGIHDIAICADAPLQERLQGCLDYAGDLDLHLTYLFPEETKSLGQQNTMLVFDTVFLYGPALQGYFLRAMDRYDACTVLATRLNVRNGYGKFYLPVLFCPAGIVGWRDPLPGGSMVIDQLPQQLAAQGLLCAQPMVRGTISTVVSSGEELARVQELIGLVEHMTGDRIYDLREMGVPFGAQGNGEVA